MEKQGILRDGISEMGDWEQADRGQCKTRKKSEAMPSLCPTVYIFFSPLSTPIAAEHAGKVLWNAIIKSK